MTLKQSLRRILPPIVVDGLRYARRGFKQETAEWEYVPDGWETRDSRIKGWNVESVAETQISRWPDFVRRIEGTAPLGISHESPVVTNSDYAAHNTLMCYAYVLALTARKKERISLLDWGGGIGHYYLISKALLPDLELDYHCYDTPVLCEVGRQLLPERKFYTKPEDCFQRRYDLVLASTSLHYFREWQKVASQLSRATLSYLYITRLPVVNSASSFVVVQRPYRYGYETEYLGWFLNRNEFLDSLRESGMKLIREFLIQETPFVRGAPEQCQYRGFLFQQSQTKE